MSDFSNAVQVELQRNIHVIKRCHSTHSAPYPSLRLSQGLNRAGSNYLQGQVAAATPPFPIQRSSSTPIPHIDPATVDALPGPPEEYCWSAAGRSGAQGTHAPVPAGDIVASPFTLLNIFPRPFTFIFVIDVIIIIIIVIVIPIPIPITAMQLPMPCSDAPDFFNAQASTSIRTGAMARDTSPPNTRAPQVPAQSTRSPSASA